MSTKIIGPIKTELREGDAYVDVPVMGKAPVYCGKEPMTTAVLRYFERTPFRWMKPDGKGRLKPR